MDGRTPPLSQSSQAYLLSPVETVPNSGFTSLYDSTNVSFAANRPLQKTDVTLFRYLCSL